MNSLFKGACLLFILWCLVSGFVDLDWMIVANHFDMWNAQKDTWEFFPGFHMNWWWAYIFSLARIIVGVGGTSIIVYKVTKE